MARHVVARAADLRDGERTLITVKGREIVIFNSPDKSIIRCPWRRLKKLVAERDLEIEVMKELAAKLCMVRSVRASLANDLMTTTVCLDYPASRERAAVAARP